MCFLFLVLLLSRLLFPSFLPKVVLFPCINIAQWQNSARLKKNLQSCDMLKSNTLIISFFYLRMSCTHRQDDFRQIRKKKLSWTRGFYQGVMAITVSGQTKRGRRGSCGYQDCFCTWFLMRFLIREMGPNCTDQHLRNMKATARDAPEAI